MFNMNYDSVKALNYKNINYIMKQWSSGTT